nr:hypothetical protein [Providencia sp. PROV188]
MKHSCITPIRSDDEKTLEELKEEVAYLRAENAVLKSWKRWNRWINKQRKNIRCFSSQK